MWAAAFSPSLCALFCVCFLSFLFSPSFQPGTQAPAQNNTKILFYFFGEIWLRDSRTDLRQRVRAGAGRLEGCSREPRATEDLVVSVSNGNLQHGLLLQMIRLNETQPQFSSRLAFKQEEITDDDIRVGESEE